MNEDLNPNLALMAGILTRGSIHLIEVAGVKGAVYSCTKPFHLTNAGDYARWLSDSALQERSFKVADKLAWRANGENKFLRMITAQFEINAPRTWWSHFDTYKVGTVAQSESTMHSLAKQPLSIDQCEIGTLQETVASFNALLASKASIDVLKYNLPEGFLQSRVVTISYASLQTMWYQRYVQERLGWWKVFLGMYDCLPYSRWLHKKDDSMQNRFRA